MRKQLRFIIIPIFLLVHLLSYSQLDKKQVKGVRITDYPKIDGFLTDDVWNHVFPATDFFQYEPYNGRPSTEKTEVKFLYDNTALYIGAMMYDSSPDSILTELGFRDADNLNADFLSVDISPYNDGLNAVAFKVTASGVQLDEKYGIDSHDENWDAVWQSAVKILDNGWSLELKIPYSALRFPDESKQTWGLNIWRSIRRKREIVTWNFIDKKIEGIIKQSGELTGLDDLKPPLRLSFVPYVSGYVEKLPEYNNWDYSFNYGMDLKYGINESFTLDMTLIPDFGQVQSDDKIYNLSPFEIYYDEKRPFFTEGTELFEKGNIFYSRRIGDTPDYYNSVEDSLKDGEYITDNPTKTKLINATKISGRTNKGLGIGLFNAMTSATYANISDSLGNERKVLTQPFTNYNMLVLDQNLKNNSYLSFYNTNVYKGRDYITANVSGTEFRFFNKAGTYSLFGLLNVSQQYSLDTCPDLGFKYNVGLSKVSGNFRFSLSRMVESDKYDPNEIGFLKANNEVENQLTLRYNKYDPFWKLMNWYNSLSVFYETLYAPNKFTEFGFGFTSNATWKNYLTTGFQVYISPVNEHDYYEARTDGRVFIVPPCFDFNLWLSPDYRKPFIIDFSLGFGGSEKYNQKYYWFDIEPRWRVNDRFMLTFESEFENEINDIGYVTHREENNEIIFGRRDIQTVENLFETSYIFNNKVALNFRIRHYWIVVKYQQYYLLAQYGYLDKTDYDEVNDFNFNAFNIDMIFRWEFAPGSELALAWKNDIITFQDKTAYDFFNNLKNTLNSPAANSFSVKILYYLDYQYFKKKR